MAVKLVVVVLAALTIASASSDRVKRQSGGPDFSEYFNKFQEQMKPITSQFPSMPNGFGSFPSFPGMGGSTAGGSPAGGSAAGNTQNKREINPTTISEWFNQFQGTGGGNFPDNLPFKPQFGQFPFPGSSGSSETTDNQNS